MERKYALWQTPCSTEDPMSQPTGDQNDQPTDTVRPPERSNGTSGAQAPGKPPSSEWKIKANRENSKHSTGPRTERGKAAIGNNAWRHGLYANDAVIREGPGQENEEEFQALLRGFQRSWEPSNAMQEYQVRTLAETEWRLQRVVRAEVGEIRRQTELHSEMQSTRHSMVISNVESKLKLLTEVRDDVEKRGYVSDALQKQLESLFGKDDVLVAECHEISQLAQKQQEEQDLSDLVSDLVSSAQLEQPQDGLHDGDPGPEPAQRQDFSAEDSSVLDYKSDLLLLIDNRTSILKQHLGNLSTEQLHWHEANLLAYKLPSREFADTLIRYETALEKKKERIIKLLLQLKGK
jgi:hypothetical protein